VRTVILFIYLNYPTHSPVTKENQFLCVPLLFRVQRAADKGECQHLLDARQ
jgi:hypothetical protein